MGIEHFVAGRFPRDAAKALRQEFGPSAAKPLLDSYAPPEKCAGAFLSDIRGFERPTLVRSWLDVDLVKLVGEHVAIVCGRA